MARKPTYTTSQIINQLMTSWGGSLAGYKFNWTLSSITYSINSGSPTNSGTIPSEASGYVSMSPDQVRAAELAFQLWADLINKPMVETQSSSANITLDYSSKTSSDGTYTVPFGTVNSNKTVTLSAEQIWLSANWSTNQTPDVLSGPGNYGFITMVHEIGHALGLSHPGAYNAGSGGTITYANSAVFAQDNREYTIMSYFGGYDPVAGKWQQDGTYLNFIYPQTPMVYDIAAIQAKYGANMSTRTGDTIYGFHSNIGGIEQVIYDFSLNTTPIFTIWDAGGKDTLDCSGYNGNQTINLTPGSYSSVDGMVGNVAIAFNCNIECAVGGSGNDTLIAGLPGEQLTGGLGSDTFIFKAGISGQSTGFEIITDYQIGTDHISFSTAAFSIGGSAAVATTNLASVNQSNGVATFYSGTGLTLSSALSMIVSSFTAAKDKAGELAFFRVGDTGDYYEFISDGTKGLTANDVVIQLVGVTDIHAISLASGVLTIAN